MSPDQVKIGFDLLVQAVQAMGIDPVRAMRIPPYDTRVAQSDVDLKEKLESQRNVFVRLIEIIKKRQEYELLRGMPEASNADSFQSQETDIVVVLMGTTHPRPGPGSTSKARRLNAMLPRQRSALIHMGDINVAHNSSYYIVVDESTGARSWVVGESLNSVYRHMKELKRVVTVQMTRSNRG
ncbi:hypothetical protein ACHAQI_008831 [Fusarium lateritium]